MEVLKDLNKVLKLVIKQEKKYKIKVSTYSNFYCHHIIVQQFLQFQLSSQPNKRQQNISCRVAQLFGKKRPIARNIV